jgi:hypothetical protein
MAAAQWIRVLDTVASLAPVVVQFFGGRPAPPPPPPTGEAGVPGALDLRAQGGLADVRGLEARLAGVVVAALKEAFDRDKARMDLERETLQAERSRAERALQAELRRQAADRELVQLRLLAVFSGFLLLVSGVLAAWVTGMRTGISSALLTVGWALALAVLGCVFAGWQQVTVWASATEPPPAGSSTLVKVAPWLMLGALAAVAASLLFARS